MKRKSFGAGYVKNPTQPISCAICGKPVKGFGVSIHEPFQLIFCMYCTESILKNAWELEDDNS